MLVLNVTYKCKPEMRDSFLERLEAEGVGSGSRADEGNIKYDYYLPANGNADELLLVEKWESAEALAKHIAQPHLAKLRAFKEEYVLESVVEKFEA